MLVISKEGPADEQHMDGLVQERRNSSALAMELCLSCTNLLRYSVDFLTDNYT